MAKYFIDLEGNQNVISFNESIIADIYENIVTKEITGYFVRMGSEEFAVDEQTYTVVANYLNEIEESEAESRHFEY